MDRNYISNEDVLLEVRRMTCAEGRAKGTDLFRVTNEAGLDFDVLIDRCMGIGQLRAGGKLYSYTSETGIVHPAFYEKEGFGWLRSFGGGWLVTCGLTQVGEPCEGHGLHGRIDDIPAQEVGWRRWWEGDALWAEMTGTMYQVSHQGEYLRLRRKIRLNHRQQRIWVEDEVKNLGNAPQPFMLLYHVNMGAPFLQPGAKVTLPENKVQYFDDGAGSNLHHMETVGAPTANLDLMWLHHTTPAHAHTAVVESGGRTVTMEYSADTLPVLAQWELLQPRAYVLALEPTNTHLQGQDWERENGTLRWIDPDEEVCAALTFSFA